MQKIISFLFSLFRNKKFLALLILFGIVVKLCMLPFYPQPGGLYFFPSAVGGIYQVERLF